MSERHPSSISLAAPITAYAGFELVQRILLPAFLTGPVGLSLGATAPLLLTLRLLDFVGDLVLGALSDSVGGRKAWMLLGAAIGAPAVLATALAGAQAPLPILALWLAGGVLGWSLLNAAQAALSLEAARGIDGRGEVFAWRTIAAIVGLSVLALVMTAAGGDTARQMRWAATALVVITPAALALCVWRVAAPAPPPQPFSTQRIVDALLLAWTDARRARLASLFALSGAQSAVWATGFAFVIQHGFAAPSLLGPALLIQAAAAIAGAFVWLAALRRLGPRRVLVMIFAAEAVFALLALAAPQGQAAAVLAWVAARGLVAGAEIMVLRALSGDILDEDARRFGDRRAGANAASFQAPFAAAAALATAGLLWTLDIAGFDPDVGGRTALIVTATLGALISSTAFIIASGLVDSNLSRSSLDRRRAPDA